MPFGQGQGDNYQLEHFDFHCRGIDVMHPADVLERGYYPLLKNVRAYVDGELRRRPGLTNLITSGSLFDAPDLIHYFTSPTASGQSCYFIAAADRLYRMVGGIVSQIFTGLSGTRPTVVDVRPERSPESYLYLADSNGFKKVKFDGTVQAGGIEEIPATPEVENQPPEVLAISDFLGATPESTPELGNPWNKSVYASSLTQVNRTNTTIAQILYDSGSTGYCTIAPAAFDSSIQFHQRLSIGGEYTIVEQITNAIPSTTVVGIRYDSGTSGPCTVVLANYSVELVPNSLIQIGSELVRVEAVIPGLDNNPAIKCRTTSTHAIGATVTGFKAFRCRLTTTKSSGAAIVCKAFQAQITGGPAGGYWGNIRHNTGNAAPRDLSTINGRALEDDDEMTIGIWLDDPALLIEGRVWIDVDKNTTTSYVAEDAQRNAYIYPFTADDLQQFADSESANTQLGTTFGRIQRESLREFNAGTYALASDQAYKNDLIAATGNGRGVFSNLFKQALSPTPLGANDKLGQAGSGLGQWYQLRIPIGLLKQNRVGTDSSRTLKDCTGIMVNFKVSDTTNVAISSWWIGGSAGPSTLALGRSEFNSALFYLTIPRNRNTGQEGLPSPPTRTGLIALRQKNLIRVPMVNDTQVTNVDVYRFGGTLPRWSFVGTVTNNPGGAAVDFVDHYSDAQIQFNRQAKFDRFAPFPTTDLPHRMICDLVGSRLIWQSGDNFDTRWAPGTEVIVDGQTMLLYQSPLSTTEAELTESNGYRIGVEVEFPSPLLLNTPLPVVFGPFGYGEYGLFLFGLGDSLNPGWLYWTNGNDPGSASDQNYLEISPPTQPLIGGCIYDGRPYVWTTERMYMLSLNGQGGFVAQEVANSKGAVSAHSIAVSTLIYFVGKDGIYVSEGGQPRSITDDRLYKLFPHDGQPGEAVNGIPAPDYTRSTEFQLVATGDALYFIYPIASPFLGYGEWHCLRYDYGLTAWIYDVYGDGGLQSLHYATGAGVYQLIGGTGNKNVVQLLGSTDVNDPIPISLRTACVRGQNPRANKRFGDLALELNSGGIDTEILPYVDEYATLLTPGVVNTTIRTQTIIDLAAGQEAFGKNFGVEINHAGTSGAQFNLSEWQVAWVEKPELSQLRASDWDDGGRAGSKFMQGVHIQADTFGEDFELAIEYDGGTLAETLTINHNGQVEKEYSFSTPFEAHLVRVRPVNPTGWRLFKLEWISEPTPASATVWQTQPTDHGTCGWKHCPAFYVTYSSTVEVDWTITIDGVSYTGTLPATVGKEKHFLRVPATKGKLFSYRFEAEEAFQLYGQDSCVMIAPWGRGLNENYTIDKPFGGVGRENGALI